MQARLSDADEHLHAPEAQAGWVESYGFDFAVDGGSLGGFVVLTVDPRLGRSWCWSAIAGHDRAVCVVDESEAPLPRRGAMELRAPALWLDVGIEVPYVHATVGMEAFGLAYDDPDEALRSGRGERTPYGLDLEWESDDGLGPAAELGHEHYGLACRVTGEVLLGAERFEIDSPGRRWHRWGAEPWWRVLDVEGSPVAAHAVARVPSDAAVVVAARLAPSGWGLIRRPAAGAGGMAP